MKHRLHPAAPTAVQATIADAEELVAHLHVRRIANECCCEERQLEQLRHGPHQHDGVQQREDHIRQVEYIELIHFSFFFQR